MMEEAEEASKEIVNVKQRILEETLNQFNRKGLKFTMDDIAGSLSMSKKTIYAVVGDKKTLLNEMVDYCFDSIKISKDVILKDKNADTITKLKEVLAAMPDQYKNIDLRQLHVLKEKYPQVYIHVSKRLESDWETTIFLLEKGMEEGKIRKIEIPVFKTMMQATLEQFFQRDILVESGLTYNKALQEVVEILVNGIRN